MSDDAGSAPDTREPASSRARQPAGLVLPPFGGWEEEAPGFAFDPRPSLMALGVTQHGSTINRVQAAIELNHRHGNAFVQRALDVAEVGRPALPFFGLIQRQTSVLARDETAGSGGTTTINPVTNSTYPVRGRNLAEAYRSIQAYAAAHDGEAGSVTWRPGWSFTKDDDGYVTACTVTIRIRKTMPSWPGATSLSTAAKAEWDRAYGELDSHEDRHVSIIETNAEGMADAAIGLTEADAQAALTGQVEIVNTANTAIDPFETVLTTNIT